MNGVFHPSSGVRQSRESLGHFMTHPLKEYTLLNIGNYGYKQLLGTRSENISIQATFGNDREEFYCFQR